MVIAEVSVIPIGTKTPSVSRYVARALKVLRKEKKIRYELTSMGTIIEGNLEEVLRVVGIMHQSTFNGEVMRVVTTIKIDERRDKTSSMSGRVASLLKEIEN